MHLIVGKDTEEVRRALAALLKGQEIPITHLSTENFTVDTFCQEVETPPFLSKFKRVVIHDLELLPEEGQEAIRRYLEKPSPWIDLYLTAAVLTPQSKIAKLVEKGGKVQRFKEEKPWEKEKRLAEWLMQEAKLSGVKIDSSVASQFVKSASADILQSELDKLICFVGEKKEITLQDIALLSTPVFHETLWQLGDAIFTLETIQAVSIGKSLLDEGMAIFPILASLRSQCTTGLGILEAARQGDVVQKYPYLKGQLLEKKLKILNKYTAERLKKAWLLIFGTEVKTKNSATDLNILLEILIVKLTT